MLRKKLSLWVAGLAIMVGIVGCKPNTPVVPDIPIPPHKDENIVNVISDCSFKKGFNLLGTNGTIDGRKVFKKIRYGDSLATPQWYLAQWGTKFNLVNGAELSKAHEYSLSDQSKTVKVDLETNALTLHVNTEREYNTPESSREVWAHLLVEQDADTAKEVRLTTYQSLTASLEFKVSRMNKSARETTDMPAQLTWYIYVKNVNPKSPGLDSFMWFGLSLLDTRYSSAPGGYAKDYAVTNGNFIYSCAAKETIGEQPFEANKLYGFDVDLLPLIQKALMTAKENQFMKNCELSDLAITGTNFGWESFGIWDTSVTVYHMGLTGQLVG